MVIFINYDLFNAKIYRQNQGFAYEFCIIERDKENILKCKYLSIWMTESHGAI